MKVTTLLFAATLSINLGQTAEIDHLPSSVSESGNEAVVLKRVVIQTKESMSPRVNIMGHQTPYYQVQYQNGFFLFTESYKYFLTLPETLLVCKTDNQLKKLTGSISGFKAVDQSTILTLSCEFVSLSLNILEFGFDRHRKKHEIQLSLEHYLQNINKDGDLEIGLGFNSHGKLELLPLETRTK